METRQGLVYGIAFDTKEMPGKVIAVTVALDKKIINDTDEIRLDLVDHPLYRHIEDYVLANPSRKR